MAFGQRTPQYYWICEGTISDQRGSTVLVVSKAFPAEPGLSLANDLRTGSPAWNKTTLAWHRYVLHKYLPEEEKKRDAVGYFNTGRAQGGPPGTCRAGTQDAAQGVHDRDVAGGSAEQDWVYNPDQAATAPPPSLATAATSPAAPTRAASSCPGSATAQHRISNVTIGPDGCPVLNAPTRPPAPAAPAATSTPVATPAPAAPAASAAADPDDPDTPAAVRAASPRAAVPRTAVPRAVVPRSPVAAPAAAVQPTRYAVCFAFMGPPARSVYFSDPFEVTAAKAKVWSDAFREMLHAKYQFVGTISCGIRGATLEDAERFAQTQKNASRQGRKIVETGWKFQ